MPTTPTPKPETAIGRQLSNAGTKNAASAANAHSTAPAVTTGSGASSAAGSSGGCGSTEGAGEDIAVQRNRWALSYSEAPCLR